MSVTANQQLSLGESLHSVQATVFYVTCQSLDSNRSIKSINFQQNRLQSSTLYSINFMLTQRLSNQINTLSNLYTENVRTDKWNVNVLETFTDSLSSVYSTHGRTVWKASVEIKRLRCGGTWGGTTLVHSRRESIQAVTVDIAAYCFPHMSLPSRACRLGPVAVETSSWHGELVTAGRGGNPEEGAPAAGPWLAVAMRSWFLVTAGVMMDRRRQRRRRQMLNESPSWDATGRTATEHRPN